MDFLLVLIVEAFKLLFRLGGDRCRNSGGDEGYSMVDWSSLYSFFYQDMSIGTCKK